MTNPLEVEHRYREIAALCSTPISAVRRLALLDHFVRLLGEDAPAFESYVLDVAQLYRAVVPELPIVGHDPQDLAPVIERLTFLGSCANDTGATSALQTATQRLRLLQAASLAFVGELAGMLQALGEAVPEGPLPAAETPFGMFRLLLGKSDRMGFRTGVSLEQIFREWAAFHEHRVPYAFVPVVEHLLGNASTHDMIGALVRAEFQISSTSNDTQDDIVANVQDLQPHAGSTSLATAPARAARAFLLQTAQHAAHRYVHATITFTPRHLLHEGSSADLALAALMSSAILRYADQRVQYAIRPAVAFTGGILPTGAVTPVDRSALAVKVRTTFFSPAEVLVVPRAQLDEAREAADGLRVRYPGRVLEVIGVDRLRDVFSDLRIIRRSEHPRVAHAAWWLWRRRLLVGLAAVVAALLLTIAVLLSPPIDLHPVTATYEGEVLIVRNRYNAVLDEVPVGPGTVEYMRRKSHGGGDDLLHGFADVDGNGQDDLVYGVLPGAETAPTSHVYARALRSRTILWDAPVAETLHFPGSPDDTDAGFSLSSIILGRPDTSATTAVFLTANNLFFPALLRRLDFQSGTTLATYVHIGHIASALYTPKLDNGGGPALLCCGINNAFRRPFLAVFDPRFIDGHSPAQGSYMPAGLRPGLEKYYLLLPETIIGAAYHFKRKSASAVRMEFRSADRNFFVQVDDVPSVLDDDGRVMSALFYVYFDSKLRPIAVSTEESYDMLATRLAAQKIIPAVPDKRYFEEYMRGIEYWDGDRWVGTPTINRHYLEAVRQAEERSGVREGSAGKER